MRATSTSTPATGVLNFASPARLRGAGRRQPRQPLPGHGPSQGRHEHDPPQRHDHGCERQRVAGYDHRPRHSHRRGRLDGRGRRVQRRRSGWLGRQVGGPRRRPGPLHRLGRRAPLQDAPRLRVARRRRPRTTSTRLNRTRHRQYESTFATGPSRSPSPTSTRQAPSRCPRSSR